MIQTATAPTSIRSTFLIIQRLRLEAALKHRGLATQLRDGVLVIAIENTELPLLLLEPQPGTVALHIQLDLGVCPYTDGELTGFIEEANTDLQETRLEVEGDGTAALRWQRSFPKRLDTAAALDALREIGGAYAKLGTELRERFFLGPRNLGGGCVFQEPQ